MKAEQLAPCADAADGAECSYPGTSAGNCLGGVCIAAGCGDGLVTAPEQCDRTELGGTSCLDLGFYAAAGLACNPDCTFDDAACTGYCGNQVLDGV